MLVCDVFICNLSIIIMFIIFNPHIDLSYDPALPLLCNYLKYWKKKSYLFLFSVYGYLNCMYVYPPCVCLVLTEAKRVELQVIVSCLTGSGNPTWSSIRTVSAIDHQTPLQPDPRTLKSVYHREAPLSVLPVAPITVAKPWISLGIQPWRSQ